MKMKAKKKLQKNKEKQKEISIDEALSTIKEYNFNKEKLKNEKNIDIHIKQYSKVMAVIEYNGEKYYFNEKARWFEFIDEGESINKFICSTFHLVAIIKELNFKCFYPTDKDNIPNEIKKNNYDSDSLNSQNTEEDICAAFNNENITKIIKNPLNDDALLEKFKGRYKPQIKTISDISLNSSIYFSDEANNDLYIDLFEQNRKDFEGFLFKNCNILYLLGPKGVSKSLFLMFQSFSLLNEIEKYPLLYINYKKMDNFNILFKKNVFKKEMIYLFFKEKDLKYFYQSGAYKSITKQKLMKFILEFITYLLNIYKNTFRKKIIAIIDNFDTDNDEEISSIQNLINLIKTEEHINKIKLIVSGNSKFLNSKLLLYLKNELNFKNPNNGEVLSYYNIELNEKNDIKSSPLYYYKIKDIKSENELNSFKEESISQENKKFEKYNIYGVHYSLLNSDKKIKISELEKYYDILPIEYLVFNINKDNTISFNFHNEIFKLAAKRYIEFSIKDDSFRYILNDNNKNRVLQGIFEEKLLTLLISYNKVGLEDLYFKEENILEVYELYDFQYSYYTKTKKKFIKNKPIIIIQENYFGQNYDLIILIPDLYSESYIAYFIQIGLNKTKTQIEVINKDLTEKESKYKNGIKKFIGHDINRLELIFIFDYETQRSLKNNNKPYGALHCKEKNISFLLFSLEDYKLYEAPDMEIFSKLIKFEINKARNNIMKEINNNTTNNYKRKRNYNESKGEFSFLDEEEITAINNFINDDILANYIISSNSEINIKNLNQYERDKIYIFHNEYKNIYIIENKYYEIDNEELKYITKSNIKRYLNYESAILEKINETKKQSPRLKSH